MIPLFIPQNQKTMLDMSTNIKYTSLEKQLADYRKQRFLAMPLAGTLAWLITGICGLILPEQTMVWILFICTGMIVYMGMILSKWTGEDFMDRSKSKNTYLNLFMQTVVMSLLVYAIAIPFFLQDHSSLPLSIGVLTGLMWVPMTWSLNHWIGMAHAFLRTLTVLVLWYVMPNDRFVAIPFAIVILYIVAIVIMEKRWRTVNR